MQARSEPAGSAGHTSSPPDLSLALALALSTRVCHDLSGIAGALGTALQMTQEGQEADALPLAVDCARECSARLRLLRAAYSIDGMQERLESLVPGLPGAERLNVDLSGWRGAETLDSARARLAANLLLLAAAALPHGGSARLWADAEGMALEVSGRRAGWPAALAEILAEPARLSQAAGHPREVGMAILCLLTRDLGLRVTLHSETRLLVG